MPYDVELPFKAHHKEVPLLTNYRSILLVIIGSLSTFFLTCLVARGKQQGIPLGAYPVIQK